METVIYDVVMLLWRSSISSLFFMHVIFICLYLFYCVVFYLFQKFTTIKHNCNQNFIVRNLRMKWFWETPGPSPRENRKYLRGEKLKNKFLRSLNFPCKRIPISAEQTLQDYTILSKISYIIWKKLDQDRVNQKVLTAHLVVTELFDCMFVCLLVVKDMRTSANYVICATRITVCRSMSLIKRLTLIFVKKWRICFKNINQVKIYINLPVKIKSFIPSTVLLCYADFRLLKSRHM